MRMHNIKPQNSKSHFAGLNGLSILLLSLPFFSLFLFVHQEFKPLLLLLLFTLVQYLVVFTDLLFYSEDSLHVVSGVPMGLVVAKGLFYFGV